MFMFCPNCGTKNDKQAIFCESCGARLRDVPIPLTKDVPVTRPALQETFSTTRVAQTENKSALKKRNKIIIGIIIAIVIIAAAGGGYYFYWQNQNSNKVTSSSTTKKTKAKPKASTASSSETVTTTPLWSTEKTNKLSSFMSSWQKTMNQYYAGTYDDESVDDDGVSFPNDIKNGKYEGKVTVDDSDVTLKWTPKANTDKEYQVVAASVYNYSKNGENKIIAYLYVFHNDEPDVLVSQDIDSSVRNFTSSRNRDLQNGFAKIADVSSDN